LVCKCEPYFVFGSRPDTFSSTVVCPFATDEPVESLAPNGIRATS
jgi:hypothetical protein